MLSLNNLRTKFGIVLVVIIGIVLLAFVLGDLLRNPQQGAQNPVVGEIAGNDVEYSEFYAAYENARTLIGGDNASYDMSHQYIQTAWQMLLFDHVSLPQMEKLGLLYTPAEREAVLKGELSTSVLSVFAGADGKYDPRMLSLQLAEWAGNPAGENLWNLLEQQILVERTANKYNNLVRNGAYVNTLMLNKALIAANNTYKGRYVACNYSSIADSLITVSESEIKAYYKANKAKYEQEPYRTIRYALFKDTPSSEDQKAVEAAAKLAGSEFAAASNLNSYVSSHNTYASIADVYVLGESIKTEEAAALRAGKTFGPELRGKEWYASRVVKTLNAPKTVELQHIMLPATDAKLVDSIYKAAKVAGADLAALAANHGQHTNYGELKLSVLPVEWAEKCANAKANDVIKIEANNVVNILKVGKVGTKAPHYLLATQKHTVYASSETKEALYREVCDFSRKVNGTMEGFKEASKSQPTSSANIKRGDRNVQGVANSLEVIRWANKAKVGDVSDIIKLGEDYVVAVVTAVDENEYKSLEAVSAEIKNILIAQKKAALLKEKMTGASLDEIAKNAGSTVKEFSGVKTSSIHIPGLGVEPRVIGLLESVTADAAGKNIALVEGKKGVYAIIVDEVAVAEEQTLEAERVKSQAQVDNMAAYHATNAIYKQAEVKDNTPNFL